MVFVRAKFCKMGYSDGAEILLALLVWMTMQFYNMGLNKGCSENNCTKSF